MSDRSHLVPQERQFRTKDGTSYTKTVYVNDNIPVKDMGAISSPHFDSVHMIEQESKEEILENIHDTIESFSKNITQYGQSYLRQAEEFVEFKEKFDKRGELTQQERNDIAKSRGFDEQLEDEQWDRIYESTLRMRNSFGDMKSLSGIDNDNPRESLERARGEIEHTIKNLPQSSFDIEQRVSFSTTPLGSPPNFNKLDASCDDDSWKNIFANYLREASEKKVNSFKDEFGQTLNKFIPYEGEKLDSDISPRLNKMNNDYIGTMSDEELYYAASREGIFKGDNLESILSKSIGSPNDPVITKVTSKNPLKRFFRIKDKTEVNKVSYYAQKMRDT